MGELADQGMLTGLPELARRFSRKIERQQGICLSAADLELFVLSGAYGTLSEAAGAELRARSQERLRQRAPRGAACTPAGISEQPMEVLARVQQLTKPGSSVSDRAYIAALTKDA